MTPLTMDLQLKEVVKDRKESPSAVLAQALEIGLASLYRESILRSYLHKHLSRQKAVERVGAKAVTLAEEQDHDAQADIDWGMGHAAVHR